MIFEIINAHPNTKEANNGKELVSVCSPREFVERLSAIILHGVPVMLRTNEAQDKIQATINKTGDE